MLKDDPSSPMLKLVAFLNMVMLDWRSPPLVDPV